MTLDLVRDFLAACHEARRMTELMPRLPAGMSPRHIGVIDTIHQLGSAGGVRVSDVSRALGVTRPNITKLIGELERAGVVQKTAGTEDRRVVWVCLTALGERYYDYYVYRYHSWLARQFAGLDPEDLRTTVETIRRVHGIMEREAMPPEGGAAAQRENREKGSNEADGI